MIELRQQRIFRGGYSVGLQNPEISTIPHARSVKVKPDLHTPLFGQDSKVVRGPKKVSSNPAPKRSSEKTVYGPPELFVGDRQSENRRSLITPAELFVDDRQSENRRSLIAPADLFLNLTLKRLIQQSSSVLELTVQTAN